MDADAKRKFQLVLLIALVAAGARTLWIFHERSTSSIAEKPALKNAMWTTTCICVLATRMTLASARVALKGNTVWVKAGNAVAYYRAERGDCMQSPRGRGILGAAR